MVTITDKAKSKIDHLMENAGLDASYFLRVSVKEVVAPGYPIILISITKKKKGTSFSRIEVSAWRLI